MSITPLNSTQNHNTPSFGHTFKVSICIKNADNSYRFISPIKDKKLYKELNSKVVGWLNEKFLTNLRKELKKPSKRQKVKTDSDKWFQIWLSKCLYNADSDYRKFNIVRSVYNKKGLTYLATGIDVPVIENLKGATQIGIAKSDALLDYGTSHTPYVEDIVKTFKNDSIEYAKNKLNLLRSKDGKEIMLKLNFKQPRTTAKGKTVYELEGAEFYRIQKSIPLTEEEQLIAESQKLAFWEVLGKTIKHQVAQIKKDSKTILDIDKILNPLKEPPKKPRRLKKDPRQLELFS